MSRYTPSPKNTADAIRVCESVLGRGSVIEDGASCTFALRCKGGIESIVILETHDSGEFWFVLAKKPDVPHACRFASLDDLESIIRRIF
jgi:hypothetical protein